VPLLILLAVALAIWGGLLEKFLNRWMSPPVAPKPPQP